MGCCGENRQVTGTHCPVWEVELGGSEMGLAMLDLSGLR